MSQQLRRLKEAAARERYDPPVAGANYGRNVLADNDERVERILKAMGFPAWLSPSDAAALNGIPEEVFERWMKSGASDALDGLDTVNARFARNVRAQLSAAEGDLRGRIRAAKTAHEAKSLSYILDRTRPLSAAKSAKDPNNIDALADLLAAHEVKTSEERDAGDAGNAGNEVPSDAAATCLDEAACDCYGPRSCDLCCGHPVTVGGEAQ